MATAFRFSSAKAAMSAAVLGMIAMSAAPAQAQNYRGDRYDNHRGNDRYDGRGQDSRSAVSLCTRAAERGAQRYGRMRVADIGKVDRKRDGYRIHGSVVEDQRRGYGRGDRRANARFTCDVRNGRVQDVKFSSIRR
jgi:hypothetical protein